MEWIPEPLSQDVESGRSDFGHVATDRPMSFLFERRGNSLLMSDPSSPFSRYAVPKGWSSSDARMHEAVRFTNACGGGRDKLLMWKMQQLKGHKDFFCFSAASDPLTFLGVDDGGHLILVGATKSPVTVPHRAIFRSSCNLPQMRLGEMAPHEFSPDSFDSRVAMTEFAKEGFFLIRGAVCTALLNPALACFFSELGTPGSVIPGGNTVNSSFREVGKLEGRVSSQPQFQDLLLKSFVGRIVAQMMGSNHIADAIGEDGGGLRTASQIAVRFPDPLLREVPSQPLPTVHDSLASLRWHIDGSYTHQRNYHNFSLLVGIALTECTLCDCDKGVRVQGAGGQGDGGVMAGNLCVWPRSHLHLVQLSEFCSVDECDYAALLKKGAPLRGYEGLPAQLVVDMAASPDHRPPGHKGPLPLSLMPGDAVILHPDTAHAAAPNYVSGNVRAMVYYRLRNKGFYHSRNIERIKSGSAVDDLFSDLPLVSEILGPDLDWRSLLLESHSHEL